MMNRFIGALCIVALGMGGLAAHIEYSGWVLALGLWFLYWEW